jgi:5-methyltetrahydropteroyltriglutamate--homocysteine methyltransferase
LVQPAQEWFVIFFPLTFEPHGHGPETFLPQRIDCHHVIAASGFSGGDVGVSCRGHWIGSGGYEPIAERFFNGVNADAFLLEYDSERAGDFSPLRHLPAEKGIVLGLVSSKTPQLEEDGFLKRRIDAAAKFVPFERLALSPQCGFGTTVGGAPMNEDEERRKLELVGRVASAVWR